MPDTPALLETTKGKYLFVSSVTGIDLRFTKHGEYRIDRVSLFQKEQFLKLRRYKFSFKNWRNSVAKSLAFNTGDALAVALVGGTNEKAQRIGHKFVRDELNILSSARLGHNSRYNRCVVGMTGCMDSYSSSDLLIGLSIGEFRFSNKNHVSDKMQLGDRVMGFEDVFYPFPKLLRILRGSISVSSSWENILKNTSILAGRSQNSIEIADSFLWNVIALEQLLIGEKETSGHLPKLLERCAALFGYCPLWEKLDLTNIITTLYHARCRLVHEGDRRSISVENLIESDVILSNVMGAIVQNISYLKSKGDLIDFSRKVKARALLGMEPRSKKWKISFTEIVYDKNRLSNFWSM